MKVGFGWSPLDANKISNPGACFLFGLLAYHVPSSWGATTEIYLQVVKLILDVSLLKYIFLYHLYLKTNRKYATPKEHNESETYMMQCELF